MLKCPISLLLLFILSFPSFSQSFNKIWEYTGIGRELGSNGLEVVDIDADGRKEIIFEGDYSILNVGHLNEDHTYSFQSKRMRNPINGIATSDIDRDGTVEIIVIERLGLLSILDGKTLEVEYSHDFDIINPLGVAVFDTNEDDIFEFFIVEESKVNVYAFSGLLYTIDTKFIRDIIAIEFEDIDGDGDKDLVMGSPDDGIKVFDNFDTQYSPNSSYSQNVEHLVLEDLNNNGQNEIIAHFESEIFAFDGKTQDVIFSSEVSFDRVESLGAIPSRLDEGGQIVLGSGFSNGTILAYTLEGNIAWEKDLIWPSIRNLEIADSDGDDDYEVLWGTNFQGFYIMDASTQQLEFTHDNRREINFHVDDFDFDGVSELILFETNDSALSHTLTIRNPENLAIISEQFIDLPPNPFNSIRSGHTRNRESKELVWNRTKEFVVYDPMKGDTIFTSTVQNGQQSVKAINLGDVNQDSIDEIIVAYESGQISIFQYKDEEYKIWADSTLFTIFRGVHEVVIGNFDTDPDLEFATILFAPNEMAIFDLPSFEQIGGTGPLLRSSNELYAGDFNKDGIDDLVFGDGVISIWDGASGEIINQFIPERGSSESSNIGIGNLDSEPDLEILYGFSQAPLILETDSLRTIGSFELSENDMIKFYVEDIDNSAEKNIFILGPRGVFLYRGSLDLQISTSNTNNTLSPYPLDVFPNPSSSLIHIENGTSSFEPNSQEVIILSSNGQRLFKDVLSSRQINIDISNFARGLYHILLLNNGRVVQHDKFLKN